jgi:cytoplasmic iron level regulating protein YaaA (DUF328/UPF0246 family)
MGTALKGAHGKDLYQFWGSRIADYLNQRLKVDVSPVVVNLASQEYFRSVDTKVLKARVVECVFQDYKNGQYKVISFFAKRARGLMARYAIDNQISLPDQLRGFNLDGYAWAAAQSTPEKLIFRRKISL